MNEAGVYLWERLDGKRPLAELAARLSGEFEVSPAQAEADVLEWAGSLLEAGLAERI